MSKSQNGWPVQATTAGLWPHPLVGPILAGPVWVVFRWLIAAFDLNVEPVQRAQSGCYNRRRIAGSSKWSNHASATAVDLNWNLHPPRGKYIGFSKEQIAAITAILHELPVIRWGGSIAEAVSYFEAQARIHQPRKARQWPAFPDPMHFEIAPGVTLDQVEKVATKLLQAQLIQLGHDLGKAGIDGVRGPKTAAALTTFQADAGLKPDGVDGPKTWAAITTKLAQEATA